MTREEAMLKWIIPAIKNTWNERKCKEILKALEQEPFINKPCVSSGVCEHDKQKVLDKIIAEIKDWYWQADKQALAKDPCVVDAMVDLFIRTIDKYKNIPTVEAIPMSVIEDIKAEIEDLDVSDLGKMGIITVILEIIDKHIADMRGTE